MKTTAKKIDIARQNSFESASRRGKKTVAGAFAKTGKPGVSLRGDTSTRNALSRIWMAGETPLREALASLSTETRSVGGYRDIKEVLVPVLPSNWGNGQSVHSLDGGQSWKGWFSMDPFIFESAARQGGWMRAMAELIKEHPGWFRRASKALAKSPERGYNSPRNNCAGIIGFLTGTSIERWRTPGHAFRSISSGISRAKGILKGFNITTIPWVVVMEELAAPRGPQRGGKIGRRLALKTLSHLTKVSVGNRANDFVRFKGFRHDTWRAMIPENQEFYRMKMREGSWFEEIVLPPVREDDGVKMFVLSETVVRSHTVVEGLIVQTLKDKNGKSYVSSLYAQTVMVSPSNRTYHLGWTPSEFPGQKVFLREDGNWSLGYGEIIPDRALTVPTGSESVGKIVSGSLRFWQRFAVRLAENAWRKQDSLAKAEGLELPSDRSILVWFEDSYSAGNCEAGTRAFAENHGWGERKFVPAQWLLGKESRARAAAKVALARYWATQATKVA